MDSNHREEAMNRIKELPSFRFLLLFLFIDIRTHVADAIRQRDASKLFFHALFHISKHSVQNGTNVMPDNTGVIRILMNIKQMQQTCRYQEMKYHLVF